MLQKNNTFALKLTRRTPYNPKIIRDETALNQQQNKFLKLN